MSYLKFLVTFVARDVNLKIDTKDDQDPISAASFEASGKLKNLLKPHSLAHNIAEIFIKISRDTIFFYYRNQNSS